MSASGTSSGSKENPSSENTTEEPTFQPNELPSDDKSAVSEPDSIIDLSDWNLLAPSHETISQVNVDNSEEITSDEIYTFLSGIKARSEQEYHETTTKFDATMRCVTAGLQEFQKATVSMEEYHVLVKWMYAHCAVDGPFSTTASSQDGQVTQKHMTKLEFYYQIRDHFMSERAEMVGSAEAARLRSSIATIQREKLLVCIEEASGRFGSYTESELPQHFHEALTWVENECIHS